MTKRLLWFTGGFAVGTVVSGVFGVVLGYVLQHSGEPAVVVRNLTKEPLSQIRIETDTGELYTVETVAPGDSRRTQVSGRPKALWVVVASPDGTDRKTREIYVDSHGIVFVAVCDDALSIDYEL